MHVGVWVGVWVCVGVYYVSMIKWKPLFGMNDLELGTVVLDTVNAYWFWVQKIQGHGHKVIILNFWHQLPPSELNDYYV